MCRTRARVAARSAINRDSRSIRSIQPSSIRSRGMCMKPLPPAVAACCRDIATNSWVLVSSMKDTLSMRAKASSVRPSKSVRARVRIQRSMAGSESLISMVFPLDSRKSSKPSTSPAAASASHSSVVDNPRRFGFLGGRLGIYIDSIAYLGVPMSEKGSADSDNDVCHLAVASASSVVPA